MRVSIKKTVVAAIAALGMATAVASTPAQAQWHGGAAFIAAAFTAEAGMAAAGEADGMAAGAALDGAAGVGAGGVLDGVAAVGTAAAGAAVGAEVGVGAGIRAGRSQPLRCRSGSRSLRSPSMATVPVAGLGDGFGQRADTILADGS